MGRINQYPLDDEVNLNDKLLGSDAGQFVTKNFSIQQLFTYFQQNLSIDTQDLVVIENHEARLDEIETEFVITSSDITGLSATSVIKSYVDTQISGVSQISTEQANKIEESHGWGNHALAGYLTSETDPNVPSHVKSISTTDISEWDSAYTNMITGIDISENTDGSVKTVTLLRANTGSNLSDNFTDISETGTGGITDTNYYLSSASLDVNGVLQLGVTGATNLQVNFDDRYYTETEIDAFNYVDLTDFSITTATASGGGALSYDNLTGVFTFTPATFSGTYLPISGGTMTGFIDFSTESTGLRGDIYNEDSTKILQNGSDSAEAWFKGRLIGDITDSNLNVIFDSSEGTFKKDIYLEDGANYYDIILGYANGAVHFTNDYNPSNQTAPIESLTAAKISTWDSIEPISNMYFFEEGSTDTFRLRLRKQTDSLSTNTSVLVEKGSYMTMSVVDDSIDTYTHGSNTVGALNIGLNYDGQNGLQSTLDTRYAQIGSVVTGISLDDGAGSVDTATAGTFTLIPGSNISIQRDGTNTNDITFAFDNSSNTYLTTTAGNNAYVQNSAFTSNGLMRRTNTNTYDTITDNSDNWNTAYNKYTTGVQFITGTGGAVSTQLVKRDTTTVTTANNITGSSGITVSASSNVLDIAADTTVLASKSYVDNNFALNSALPTAQEETEWNSAYTNAITGLEFNTTSGVLTLQKGNGTNIDLTKNLDGRYLTTHPAVAAASDVDNSGNTFIQDLDFDSYGHVMSVGSATFTESDPVFTASAASGISTIDIGEWDTAYSDRITAIELIIAAGNDAGKIKLTKHDNNTILSNSLDSRYAQNGSHIAVANVPGDVDESGNTFIQDISFDSFGHVNGIATASVSGFLALASGDTPTNTEIAQFNGSGEIVSTTVGSFLGTNNIVTTTSSPNFSSNTITAGDFILSSDRDLKENIIPLAERKIDVDFKEYNFKGSKRTRFGVIAQELEEKHPEFVHTRESGDKSVSYIDLLVAKVHELENRIKELENGSRNR